MASGDALPDAQVEHLRGRLSDFDLLVSSAQMLESVLDRRVRSDIPLELRLEQASDQTSRLVAALQAEAHASASAEAEMRNVAALEERLAEYSQQGDRMRDARQLMNDLLEQAKAGVFADQVIRANATTIGSIFAAIHSPNEFSVEVGQTGALSIVRRDTSQVVSLHQMSTGQRSAYALALFLSMNSRLTAGPPLVLLDDPIAHIDDLNILSFLDHLRDIAVVGSRQIFLATANDKLAGLFRQKFRFMGDDRFRELPLSRN